MMLHRAPSRTLILKEWRYVPYIMCDSAVEVTLTVECRSLSLPQYGSAEFGFADCWLVHDRCGEERRGEAAFGTKVV